MSAKKSILVTGGAGYVGSHCARHLAQKGYKVVTLDNLSAGYREAACGKLIVGDVRDYELLCELLSDGVSAVMHFAALMQVGESTQIPLEYFDNNVAGSLCLLRAMQATGVNKLVVSSTCAVYGVPEHVPIDEDAPLAPINPYGETKAIMETMLRHAKSLASVSLRYFNAAGAAADGSLGEAHSPETHLIPLALQATSGGPHLTVFGGDHPTDDGTCVRDYIHVDDIARAHLLALERLMNNGSGGVWNLGSGIGYSVLDIINTVEQVTGKSVAYELGPRRNGDPPRLVAKIKKARNTLQWTPSHDLEAIIKHAWAWHQAPRYGQLPNRSS